MNCQHQWSEETETCRKCGGTDLEEIEISTGADENSLFPGVFKAKTEPLFGTFCFGCDELAMVSWAQHCALCGAVRFLLPMDAEIFGQ